MLGHNHMHRQCHKKEHIYTSLIWLHFKRKSFKVQSIHQCLKNHFKFYDGI